MTNIRARQPYARRPAPLGPLKPFLDTEFANIQRAVPVPLVRAVFANDTVQASDDTIEVDATAGPVTITLPSPDRLLYLRVTVVRKDATANVVRIAGSISGTTVVALASQWSSVTLQSDGVSWLLIGQSLPFADVTRFGAVGNGVDDDSPAFLAAIAAVGSGGTVYVPHGRYLLSAVVALTSNILLLGVGDASVIIGNVQSFISATSKTGIAIRWLQFETRNNRLLFTACTRVTLSDCLLNGLRLNGELTQQGVWSAGSTKLSIIRCGFVDFRDNVYLADDSGTVTDEFAVWQSTFSRTTNGTTDNFTTGVYCVSVGRGVISDCDFADLFPGDLTGSPHGYGVYEGDGQAQDVRVENCSGTSTDNTKPFIGVAFNRAITGAVVGCTFRDCTQGFDGASQYLRIADNTFDGTPCITSSSTGGPATYVIQQIVGNSFLNVTGAPLIVMNVGSPSLDTALIADNYFDNATKGAVWVRNVTYAAVTGNTIIDCNTSNDSNDFYRGGVNYYGCTDGFVDGNTIMNVSIGSMQYGVVSGASTHTIDVTSSNVIRNMTTDSFLRALTAPPTTGRHDRGSRWHNWTAAAAGAPGWQCVTSGTPGTWKAEAALAP